MTNADYRAGYEAGYMWGRIDALKDAPYDDRTPLQKRKEGADDVEPARRTLPAAE